MKIGFIGLGRMGFPLASHLVQNGLDVTAFDLNPTQIEKFIQLGGKNAENIQDIAKNVDVVFTMLPGPKQSKEVILGENGVLAHLAEGKYLIELSTIDTDTVDLLYQHAQEKILNLQMHRLVVLLRMLTKGNLYLCWVQKNKIFLI